MRPDSDIQHDVEAELRWTPEIDDTDVAVAVTAGVVTLSGYARNCFEKHWAQATAKRVAGVALTIDNVEVRLPPCEELSDSTIDHNAWSSLKLELPQCWEGMRLCVQDRHITLEGTVEWQYQSARAEIALRRLRGVLNVHNLLQLAPKVAPGNIKQQLQQALHRNAEIDASEVVVETLGAEVVLKGEVRSWAQWDEIQAAAWSTPGIRQVTNELAVRS